MRWTSLVLALIVTLFANVSYATTDNCQDAYRTSGSWTCGDIVNVGGAGYLLGGCGNGWPHVYSVGSCTAGWVTQGSVYRVCKNGVIYDYSVTPTGNQCYVPPPAHCTNHVIDAGEEGYDCGGTCPAACVDACPPGTTLYTAPDGHEECHPPFGARDAAGNCPPGSTPANSDGTGACVYPPVAPVLTNPDYTGQNYPGPTYTPPAGFTPTTPGYTVTYNPDGSIVLTGTGTPGTPGSGGTVSVPYPGGGTVDMPVPDPGGTTTYTPPPAGSPSGTPGTVTGTVPPEENPENYNYNPNFGFNDAGTIAETDYGQEPDWSTLQQNLDPLLDEVRNSLNNSSLVASGSCTMDMGTYFGKPAVVNICSYAGILNGAGAVLVGITYIVGFLFLWERS